MSELDLPHPIMVKGDGFVRSQPESRNEHHYVADPAEPVSAELPPCIEASTDTLEQPSPVIPCINYRQRFLLAPSYLLNSPFNPFQIQSSFSLLLRCLFLPFLLCLPSIYASQASEVIRLAEEFQADYEWWTTAQGASDSAHASQHDLPGSVEMEHGDVVELHSSGHRSTTYYPPSSYATASRNQVLSSRQQEDANKLQAAWNRYIDHRNVEWAAIATTASTFIGASLTILQMPGVSNDPITPYITFLALFRAVAAVIYSLIFIIYFRSSQVKSMHFAMLWLKEVQAMEKAAFCTPWIMLALPTVAFVWTIILILLAAFCYIWSMANRSSDSMSKYAAWALCAIVTAVSSMDIACMIWVLMTLSRFGRGVQDKQTATDIGDNGYRGAACDMEINPGNMLPP